MTPAQSDPPPRHRAPAPRWMRFALPVFIGLIVLGLLVDTATSSPRLCGSCHEMADEAASWSESAHTSVRCVTCHQTPRPWYAMPVRLAERSALLGRDIYLTVSGRLASDDSHISVTALPMPDEVCLRCHDPNRRATSGFRILIEHAEHAERTGSCVACHVYTAHPDPVRGRPLSLMIRCLDCHGTPQHPEASAECGACHPSDFDLRPPSHLEPPWMRDHGFLAVSDRPMCAMCHQQRYCDGCHGVEMPHPDGWERGAQSHGQLAEADRELCFRCHTREPDSCQQCHHAAYDPALGSWVEQHHVVTRDEGTASCLGCHEPTACVRCHRSPVGVAPAPNEAQ